MLVESVRLLFLDSMFEQRPDRILFPGLLTLTFSTSNPFYMHCFTLFLSPSLRHLTIVSPGFSFLESYERFKSEVFSNLETLTVVDSGSQAVDSSVVHSILLTSRNLTKCHLGPSQPITSQQLTFLFSLPSLQSLGMCMDPTLTSMSFIDSLNPSTPGLRELHLACKHSAHLLILSHLLSVHSPILRKLSHFSLLLPPSTDPPAIAPIVSMLSFSLSLTHISLQMHRDPSSDQGPEHLMEDPEPLSFEEGPLYSLHCLKQLQSLVVTRIPLRLDDSLPAFFSSHWPSLTSLSFLSVADTFTLTTFYHLVVQCPHLQNVSVPFSVTEDPTLLFDLIYSPPNPPFDRPLVLRDACNELPSITAALMYTSFPLVEFVGGQGLHAAPFR